MHLVLTLIRQSASVYLKAVLVATTLSLVYVTYKILVDPLKAVPGPVWARLSRLWLLRQVIQGDIQTIQTELHKNLGPVVRLAPNQYSLNDLEAVRTIYGHGSRFVKSDLYVAFGRIEEGHESLFNERDNQIHAEKRRRVAGLYSMTALLSYEAFIDQNITTLLSKLSNMASESKAFSVTDWMQYYAFDVIGSITVGQPFGFLQNGCDFQDIIKELHGAARYGTRIGTYWSKFHPLLGKIAKATGIELPRLATEKYIMDNIKNKRQRVDEGVTTEEHTGKQDFLEKMFALKEKGKLSDIDIELTVGSNIFAGSDTTAVSLSAIIYYLIKYPSAMQKLRDEIEEQRTAGKLSTPITFKEAQELPYLQAIIKESLRLHPAVGMSLPRVVPEGGVSLAGHYFPAGTIVGINPWVIHHNTDAFGPDADAFRPERWLESKERTTEMDHYFMSFGAGSRSCIGRHVSMLEINKVVPELVTQFDFELEQPAEQWKLDNIFFVFQEYKCLVRERKAVA